MPCCGRANMASSAVVCMASLVLVAVVAGDVATLVYGRCCRDAPEQAKDTTGAPLVQAAGGARPAAGLWPAGTQLVVGGALLLSALLLLVAALLLPARAPSLCQMWLTVHVTWGDDWARLAVAELHDLQVRPVLDALGLTAVAAAVQDADYWWWFAQGLLIHSLVRLAVTCGAQEDYEDEDEGEDDDVMGVEAGDARRPALEASRGRHALGPASPGAPCVTIVEVT